MAPLPDNDKTLDKSNKDRDKEKSKSSQKDEKKLSNLNDKELKALLDEAINYKNPKDREGKSELFNNLLLEAEESERIARATSAGGSELVRHCNPAARRQRHTGVRERRYAGPTSSGRSVSERGTHGGSLDNLAKEELYDTNRRRLHGARKSSTSSGGTSLTCGGNQVRVSARQWEGGSLPCNVNSHEASREFLHEAKRTRELKGNKDCPVVDLEKERLIENDQLARGYDERLIDGGGPSNSVETHIVSTTPKFIAKASMPTGAKNVDDPIGFQELDNAVCDKKVNDGGALTKLPRHSSAYSVGNKVIVSDEKVLVFQKIDENGNAVPQTKEKKGRRDRKAATDKNCKIWKSDHIPGYKSEIIDNVEQLVNYIEGNSETNSKPRSTQSKSKQLHKQHASEDGGSKPGKKKHTLSTSKDGDDAEAGAQGRHDLKKSNSLGEISGMQLDKDFAVFSASGKAKKEDENVMLRSNKHSADRTRERRSWGDVEPRSFDIYNASSLENLESSTADNWEVTRPKKKSKKRRNSVSSAGGARQNSSASGVSSSVSNEDRRSRRAPSPELGIVIVGVSNAKTTRSMPHSEKSNDSSSDVDSVHSLPMDGPISYADIAKNSEKKKQGPEKQQHDRPLPVHSKEKSPPQIIKHNSVTTITTTTTPNATLDSDFKTVHVAQLATQNLPEKVSPTPAQPAKPAAAVPDVHNIKSFPAITGTVTKTSTTTSDKAVQSTLSYEETFVREKQQQQQQQLQQQRMVQEATSAAPVQNVPTEQTTMTKKPQSSNKEKRNKAAKEGVASQTHSGSVPGFFANVNETASGELTFMRDPAQYNNLQRMPADIVDVSTIEKMQMLNCSGTAPPSPLVPPVTNTPHITAYHDHAPSTGAVGVDGSAHHAGMKGKRKKGSNHGGSNTSSSSNSNSRTVNAEPNRFLEESVAAHTSVCDSNMEERAAPGRIVNGISDEIRFSSPEPHRQCAAAGPPVVIMSDVPKEPLSDVEFGFEVNEQLLMEGAGNGREAAASKPSQHNVDSENDLSAVSLDSSQEDYYVCGYVPPPDRGPPSYNYDKVLNYVINSWNEAVSSETLEYYRDDL